MAKLKIVKYGDETLRKVCRPVEKITPRTLTLLDDMIETMRAANGCGLAAPQVTYLSEALRRAGVALPQNATTIEEAKELLLADWRGGRG